MAKVYNFASAKSQGVIGSLETMLAKARRGELTSVFIAGVKADGVCTMSWYYDNMPEILGSVEAAKHGLLSCCDAEDVPFETLDDEGDD